MHDDDREIEAIRSGDFDAMANLIERHRKPLLAFIENRMGDALRRKIDAEDIFQEVCAQATRSFATVDLSERKPFSWLCQLAERRIIDAHRHFFDAQKRDAAKETPLQSNPEGGGNVIDWLVQSMTTPSQAFSRNVKQQRLASAIEKLDEQSRQALRMRYVDGLPSKEIASQLDKSDAAVRVMLTRAIKRLQAILDEPQ